MRRAHEPAARMLLAACASSAGPALAQSLSAKGQIGYLQEWEMQANLAGTADSTGYAGAITLRHVGLCSINGSEEKTGTLELHVSTRPPHVEGTLALADDKCHLAASGAQGYSGLLKCRDGQDVPINFSIEPLGSTAHIPTAVTR